MLGEEGFMIVCMFFLQLQLFTIFLIYIIYIIYY